ncbi:hypothetical protein KNE206_18190 [Kitasatospora sp. NE20-6]
MKKQWESTAPVREDAGTPRRGFGGTTPVRQGRPAGLVAHAHHHTRSDLLGGLAMRASVFTTYAKNIAAPTRMSGWGRRGARR